MNDCVRMNDASFEAYDVAQQGVLKPITGWTATGKTTNVRIAQEGGSVGPADTPWGSQFLVVFDSINVNTAVYQDTNLSYCPGQEVTFSVWVAKSANQVTSNTMRLEFRDAQNQVLIFASVVSESVTTSWQEYTLSYTPELGDAHIGDAVRVALRFSGAGTSYAVDNAGVCVTSRSPYINMEPAFEVDAVQPIVTALDTNMYGTSEGCVFRYRVTHDTFIKLPYQHQGMVTSVFFVDHENYYSVGADGVVYMTIDGVLSNETLASCGYLTGVTFVAGHGFVAIDSPGTLYEGSLTSASCTVYNVSMLASSELVTLALTQASDESFSLQALGYPLNFPVHAAPSAIEVHSYFAFLGFPDGVVKAYILTEDAVNSTMGIFNMSGMVTDIAVRDFGLDSADLFIADENGQLKRFGNLEQDVDFGCESVDQLAFFGDYLVATDSYGYLWREVDYCPYTNAILI